MGPALASVLFASPSTSRFPFYLAGLLKIAYDLLLLRNFRNVQTREEAAGPGAGERKEVELPRVAAAPALSDSPPRPMQAMAAERRSQAKTAVDYMPLEVEDCGSEEEMEL